MPNENLFIVPSIRPFPYWADYLRNFSKNGHDISKMDVLIVDEGEEKGRATMKQLYPQTNFEFFGPKEREDFFRSRFGENHKSFLSVIPERNHAETSFGMLVALERKPKFVYMVDDDTTPVMEHDFVGMHTKIVGKQANSALRNSSKWYNTMDALEYSGPNTMKGYPRGFPYATRFIESKEKQEKTSGRIAINQGLWLNVPDWDSINITAEGGLDGLSKTRVSGLKHKEIILSKGTFTTVCSMNVCFSPEIIPAYYQLPMGGMGISRFDDIWSGIFVKKVCDAVGDNMSLGAPCVIHNKERRNVFKDLRAELEGIIINEHLWQLVDNAEINSKDYFSGYEELIAGLKKGVDGHNPPLDQNTKKYWEFLLEKMSLWLKVCDKLM